MAPFHVRGLCSTGWLLIWGTKGCYIGSFQLIKFAWPKILILSRLWSPKFLRLYLALQSSLSRVYFKGIAGWNPLTPACSPPGLWRAQNNMWPLPQGWGNMGSLVGPCGCYILLSVKSEQLSLLSREYCPGLWNFPEWWAHLGEVNLWLSRHILSELVSAFTKC